MNETFQHFGSLPKELRDEIWRLAIRPLRPSAHVFDIYNQDEDEGAGDYHSHVFSLYGWFSANCIAVPPSGTADNPSAYLIDWGLWTACKESRHAMERHLGSLESRACQNMLVETTSTTVCFSGAGSADRYVTAFPHLDLFILRPWNLQTFDWTHIRFGGPTGPGPWTLTELKNIALEYKPEWGVEMAKAGIYNLPLVDFYGTLVDVAFGAYGSHTIWLVDYSLRRKNHAPREEEEEEEEEEDYAMPEGETFYAGDRRFVEVECDHRTRRHWEHANGDEAGGSYTSSVWLVTELRDTIQERSYWEESDTPCWLGLLACEYL